MSKQTFDFSEALKRMKQGKKVRREYTYDWFTIDDGQIRRGCQGRTIRNWSAPFYPFNYDDILATDWEEVSDDIR